jgi:class 3 adenylate cyclase
MEMLTSLSNRMLLVENPETGKTRTLLLSFEEGGYLTVADVECEIPHYLERRKIDVFPTDEVLCDCAAQILGEPCRFVKILDRNMELDSSALSGLRKMPVDIFDNVYLDEVKNDALILCVDIRNFSKFLRDNPEQSVFSLIKDFTSNFLSCVNQFAFGCSYYKLLGDGALVIWDDTNESTVGEALSVFNTYIDFANEELFRDKAGIGLAGALVTDKVFKYEISAEASQLKYRDYVGYGINLACRLQGLASKDQLVLNRRLTATGLVSFRSVSSVEDIDHLQMLKGLKDEDSSELFYFQK